MADNDKVTVRVRRVISPQTGTGSLCIGETTENEIEMSSSRIPLIDLQRQALEALYRMDDTMNIPVEYFSHGGQWSPMSEIEAAVNSEEVRSVIFDHIDKQGDFDVMTDEQISFSCGGVVEKIWEVLLAKLIPVGTVTVTKNKK